MDDVCKWRYTDDEERYQRVGCNGEEFFPGCGCNNTDFKWCPYCGKPLERKLRGGDRKRFCGAACRKQAWVDGKLAEIDRLVRELVGRKA